jgi:GTP-binding protein HflX
VSAERLALLEGWFASSVPVSATAGTGVDRLLARIAEEISAGFVPVTVRIPYGMTQLVALFRSHGMVETELHQPEGTRISGRLPTALIPSFQQFLA